MKTHLIMLTVMVSIQTWGQHILTTRTNAIRDSDHIAFQCLDCYNPGVSGPSPVWDFSTSSVSPTSYDISCAIDTLGQFHKTDNQGIYSYIMECDTLKQYKYEDRLTKIIYFDKKLAMIYPFHLGDSVCSGFEGYGIYCGDHLMKVKGQVMIQADGLGRLILSKNDTLDNVLRVYTLTTTSMAMGMDYAEIDSTQLRQEIEEKYEWYGSGARYPVLTIIQRTSFTNLDPVGSSHIAFRQLPENLSLLNDAVNDSILHAETERKDQTNMMERDMLHYEVNVTANGLEVSYTAEEDANITVLVANVSGVLYKKQTLSVRRGDTGIIDIKTNGMPKGQYAMYINTNGKIFSRTFNVR